MIIKLGDRVVFNPSGDGQIIPFVPPAGTEFHVTATGTNEDGLTLLYGAKEGPVLAVDCRLVGRMRCDR